MPAAATEDLHDDRPDLGQQKEELPQRSAGEQLAHIRTDRNAQQNSKSYLSSCIPPANTRGQCSPAPGRDFLSAIHSCLHACPAVTWPGRYRPLHGHAQPRAG